MATSVGPPSGGLIIISRTIAVIFIQVSVFAFMWLLLDHGFDLKSALLGAGGGGAVAAEIAHRLLGPLSLPAGSSPQPPSQA